MDIQAEKLSIIQWLAGINDSNVIRKFKELKSAEEIPFENLSNEEKDAIDKGLKSIADGRFKTHDDVLEATKERYPQLFK